MAIGILTQLIDSSILLSNMQPEPHRDYIGASSIGNPCERAIWYGYTNVSRETSSARQNRTFAVGKHLESLVLDCLEQAGIKLVRKWYPLKDNKIDIFQGHVDAMWLLEDNAPKAVIEVKTARDSSFKTFVNKGLMQWYPTYYAQVQAYMGMSGVSEAYVVALNKDTSELHDERVLFDSMYYDDLRRKVQRIVDATEAPNKINSSPLYYICRGCSFKGLCHS